MRHALPATAITLLLACVLPLGMPVVGRAQTSTAAVEQQLKALNAQVERAFVDANAAFFEDVLSPDFYWAHGDAWTSGGAPSMVDTKATVVSHAKPPSTYASREISAQQVELHGDVAVTVGRVHVRPRNARPEQEYTIWYERVWALRDGRWRMLSNRTVHESYGPD